MTPFMNQWCRKVKNVWGGGAVALGGIVCPPQVGKGLTDLPNMGGGAVNPLSPPPSSSGITVWIKHTISYVLPCVIKCKTYLSKNLKHNWKKSMTASFARLWSRYQILILNCLFVTGFFVNCFGCFNKDKWLFCHLFEYFDSQTKICFEGIKTSSKFGETNLGFVKTRSDE